MFAFAPCVAGLVALIWTILLVGRGGFWLMRARDDRAPLPPDPVVWPSVAAVIPARDESQTIAAVIASLARQDYDGAFSILLIDDSSSDGTAAIASAAASKVGWRERVTIIRAEPLATGWTGKVAALAQGVAHLERQSAMPTFLWLTDADIVYAPDTLRALVARAQNGGLVLTSLMAQLRCVSLAERWLVPAFVFFFAMLYPFDWINRPRARTAAAAGGCMLARSDALAAAGGMACIHDALIDDCALGAQLKRQGPIWLGLSRRATSLRGYGGIGEFGQMVARSAYAQLGYRPLWLAGTVVGMILIYLAPPLLALFGDGAARWIGLTTYLAMILAFAPIAAIYQRPILAGAALPFVAAAYAAFTLYSAYQHWRGRGGFWKDRVQAMPLRPS